MRCRRTYVLMNYIQLKCALTIFLKNDWNWLYLMLWFFDILFVLSLFYCNIKNTKFRKDKNLQYKFKSKYRTSWCLKPIFNPKETKKTLFRLLDIHTCKLKERHIRVRLQIVCRYGYPFNSNLATENEKVGYIKISNKSIYIG